MLAHTAPMPPMLGRVLNGPHGSLKQNPDGRFVTGLDYRPGAAGEDVSDAYGRTLLATAQAMYPPMKGATLEKMTFGRVPMTPDHQPIVGYSPNAPGVYAAAMMSGITMAALMGRLIATEIAGGVEVDLLAAYRPARFA
jgi:glycine/D-amino acid oxidase-like deaminating enzyme